MDRARAQSPTKRERERRGEDDVLLLTVSPPPAASARYRPRLAGDGIWRAAWLSGDVGRFGPRPDVLALRDGRAEYDGPRGGRPDADAFGVAPVAANAPRIAFTSQSPAGGLK